MSITLSLLIITGLISYRGLSDNRIVESLKHHPYSEHKNKEYYRLLSSGFVHGSMRHLLINCFVLYMFGTQIESVFKSIFGDLLGVGMFILLYLTSIVISDLPTLFKHKHNYNYAALGASGATSAIVMIYCMLDPWAWFLYPPAPAIIVGVGYIAYSIWADKTNRQDGIGHSAHLYGAVYGILFIAISKVQILGYFFSKLLEGPSMPSF